MKISIDTAQDSKEEIRKAITLLQALVGHDAQVSRDIFSSPGTDLFGNSSGAGEPNTNPATAFGDLFGDDNAAQKSETKKEEQTPKIELY